MPPPPPGSPSQATRYPPGQMPPHLQGKAGHGAVPGPGPIPGTVTGGQRPQPGAAFPGGQVPPRPPPHSQDHSFDGPDNCNPYQCPPGQVAKQKPAAEYQYQLPADKCGVFNVPLINKTEEMEKCCGDYLSCIHSCPAKHIQCERLMMPCLHHVCHVTYMLPRPPPPGSVDQSGMSLEEMELSRRGRHECIQQVRQIHDSVSNDQCGMFYEGQNLSCQCVNAIKDEL